ncbi:MAG: dipeptidase [Gillisia sp.]
MEEALKIHQKLITVDTHIDIKLEYFTDTRNYSTDLNTQFNLPKMQKGGLDIAWLVVYTPQGELNDHGYKKAYQQSLEKFSAIQNLITLYAPGKICLATTAEEARSLIKQGELVAMIGVENLYPIGKDLSKIKEFYKLGARYISICHNGHNQFCDSNTGEKSNYWLHNGLSDLGKKAVLEMNRLGIMVDVSHLSKQSIKQIFALSKAPIIASHSSARALSDHSRNLDDELLELFNEHGGVVQAVAHPVFVNKNKHYAFLAAREKLYENAAKARGFDLLSADSISKLSTEKKEAYYQTYLKIKTEAATDVAQLRKEKEVNVSDFIDQIDYLVSKIGINHVGISSDFDGGGGLEGWNNTSENPHVTYELLKRGYSEEEIGKLWGGNLLRVFDEVQMVARKLEQQKN